MVHEIGIALVTKRKTRSIDLEKIPEIQEKITALISNEVEVMSEKDELSDEDAKKLIAYSGTLSTMYKEYRAQIVQIEKDLKGRSKEDILTIIKSDGS